MDSSSLAMPWPQAVRFLLSALGIEADDAAPRNLSPLLTQSNLEISRSEQSSDALFAHDDVKAGLIEKADDEWLLVLRQGPDAVLLDRNGRTARKLAPDDIDENGIIWTITGQPAVAAGIAPFLSRYKGRFVDLLICALIINFFALVLPLFSSFVYDKILGNGVTETLWALVIGLVGITCIDFCVRMLRVATAEKFAISTDTDIDRNTFRNLLDIKLNKIPTLGSVLEKYKQVLSYRDFLSSSYLMSFADIPFLLLFMVAIAYAAGPLVFVGIVCGTLVMLSSLIFTQPVLDYDRDAKIESERRFSLMTDMLASREAIVGSSLRNELSKRWNQASARSARASSKARYWRGMGGSITNSLTYISFVSVLAGGVYMVEAHQLTSGGLLAASMLTSRMMSGFASVTTLIIRYREFRTALRELNQAVPKCDHGAAAPNRGRLHGALRLDRVSVRLGDGENAILSDVSLNINPGEIVGIAGAPGAGKTTLLRLITGSIAPTKGRILIDNIPLEQISDDDLAENIGFKPQDFCLLDGTIEDNVRGGREPMTPEARHQVLIASGLLRAFQENGLNWGTEIGPRGSKLSGGQRQLVSLARAFLGLPRIVILDEPTTGLDAPYEAYLAQQIAHMRGKATILVSTHSRGLLSVCDRIIVVGKSHILADGPREKVLAA